jgi:hypothetical protein
MLTDPMVSIFDNTFDSLNTSCGNVSDEMSLFRSRILKHIDDIEEKLKLEINAANSKIVAETGEEMKAVEKYMSDIQDISHKFDFITKRCEIFKHGGTFHSFCNNI